MPRPNRVAKAYTDTALSQAAELGMTPEELAMVMAPMRDPNTVYVYAGTGQPDPHTHTRQDQPYTACRAMSLPRLSSIARGLE